MPLRGRPRGKWTRTSRSSSRSVVLLLSAITLGLGASPAPSLADPAPHYALYWIKQKGATDCGRAALASLIARIRHIAPGAAYAAIGQSAIKRPAEPSRGYSIQELVIAAATMPDRKLRVRLTVYAATSVSIHGPTPGQCREHREYFENLATISAAGLPVIVHTQPTDSVPHYLLLVGYEDGHFDVLDPARGPKQMSSPALNRQMCKSNYLALVVTDDADR